MKRPAIAAIIAPLSLLLFTWQAHAAIEIMGPDGDTYRQLLDIGWRGADTSTFQIDDVQLVEAP